MELVLKTISQKVSFESYELLKNKLDEIDRLIKEINFNKTMEDAHIRDLNAERTEILGKFKDWAIIDEKDLKSKVCVELLAKEPIIKPWI